MPKPSKTDTIDTSTPAVTVEPIISVLWGAMMAATSSDLMRFVSYTSVSHFGFMVIGIFALTTTSITGSIFYTEGSAFKMFLVFLMKFLRIGEVNFFWWKKKFVTLLFSIKTGFFERTDSRIPALFVDFAKTELPDRNDWLLCRA